MSDKTNIMQDTIPTEKGGETIPQIMDRLMYGSYSANRGYGVSHEALLSIGIGNEAMKAAYEAENPPK